MDVSHEKGPDGMSVIDRLSARDAARQASLEKRAQDVMSHANPAESSAAFLETFNTERTSVMAALEVLLRGPYPPPNLADVNRELSELSNRVGKMEKETSEASYFLPLFDMRQVTSTVTNLKGEIESARGKLLPRETFSFSMRRKNKKEPPPATSESSDPPLPSTSQPSNISADRANPGRGVRGLENEVVVRTAAELSGGDYTLSDLQGCTVFLLGPLSALRIHKLRGCQIMSGPVAGATFIEDVQDCTLALASAQVRVHSAHSSRLLLRVCSNPIIEHSDSLAFGPNSFDYPGCSGHLAASGLSQDANLWSQVQDFGWLRASQSPNWRVLGAQEEVSLPKLPAECKPEEG